MTGRAERSNRVRTALFTAAYEYLLVVLPVASYVGLESFARRDGSFFIVSPEWAIATIFLLFQGTALYVRGIDATGRGLWHLPLGMLAMVILVLIAVAAINAFYSLEGHYVAASQHAAPSVSLASVVVRSSLFGLASAVFLLLVAAGKFAVLGADR
jgi:hypothetical protein